MSLHKGCVAAFIAVFFFTAVYAQAAEPFPPRAIVVHPAPLIEAQVCAKDRIIHPLTLADVVDLALCNTPEVRLQWANARVLTAQLGISRSAYFPSLSGSLSVGRNRTTFADGATTSNPKSVGITASYLLYDFGGRAAEVENAQQILLAANATRDDVLRKIFINAIQNYYSFLLAQASVNAYRVAEELAGKSRDAAQARYQAGSGTPADKLQAQTAWSQARLNRIRAEGETANARGELALSMGFDATQPFQLVTPPSESVPSESDPNTVPEQSEEIEQDIGELLRIARQNRPDLMAAEAQIKAAEAQLEITQAAGKPRLSLNGSMSQSGSLSLSKPAQGTNFSRSQGVNVTLEVPLFTGFSNPYQKRAGRARLEGTVAERDRLAQQITLDVWKAYQGLLTKSQAVRAAHDLQLAAGQSEDMISGRYKAGLGSILDVLTAQSTLANARQQFITALYEFKVSKFVLAQQIGQLDLAMVNGLN